MKGINKMESIILFGASTSGDVAYEKLKGLFKILYYCDNDSKKIGTSLNGIDIVHPNRLKGLLNGNTKVAISSQYVEEISKQLLDMGIADAYLIGENGKIYNKLIEEFYSKKQTMLTIEELQYIYDLARRHYTGAGEIVDAGCLLGGSTFAFSQGLIDNIRLQNKSKQERIHSYDIFLYEQYMDELNFELQPSIGESILPIFLKNINNYKELIKTYPGDFLTKAWEMYDIEILFVDLSKTMELNRHLVENYFAYLIPEKSIVLQQDYFHHYCFWIHITMEYFVDYFEPLEYAGGGTLSFKLIKRIPKEMLEYDFMQNLEEIELVEMMDNAIIKHENKVDAFHKNQLYRAKEKLLYFLNKRKINNR